MTWLVFNQDLTKTSKVITVSTSYRYLLEEDGVYELFIYTNDLNHPILDQKYHELTFLSDHFQNKKIEIEVVDLNVEYYEKHLSEKYARVKIRYRINLIGSYMSIEDVYLMIALTNDDLYQFYLGDIHFITEANDGKLKIKTLYGEKRTDVPFSRLKHVYVTLEENENISIESIISAYDKEHSFNYQDQVLQIIIDKEDKILHNLPFVIKYIKDHQVYEFHINNFRYVIEYETLNENGVLLNFYGLH
jgi:hypothetical protein